MISTGCLILQEVKYSDNDGPGMYPREEEQEMCIEFWCGTAMKSGNF